MASVMEPVKTPHAAPESRLTTVHVSKPVGLAVDLQLTTIGQEVFRPRRINFRSESTWITLCSLHVIPSSLLSFRQNHCRTLQKFLLRREHGCNEFCHTPPKAMKRRISIIQKSISFSHVIVKKMKQCLFGLLKSFGFFSCVHRMLLHTWLAKQSIHSDVRLYSVLAGSGS